MVEEVGQVLEAHVLGSLVPPVDSEHLIVIGDPLQLRPTLNNFGMYIHRDVHASLLTCSS